MAGCQNSLAWVGLRKISNFHPASDLIDPVSVVSDLAAELD